MEKIWRWKRTDVGSVDDLSKSANVSPIVAQMLLARGICDAATAQAFLQPKMSDLRDPESLPGLSKAADRIYTAVREGKSICIYGDYDADGMTATAILVLCLQTIGGNVSYYVPNRLEDAYGLRADALRKLADHGKQVIVTVDCGIGSIEEALLAKELGIELIITDHHTPSESLPEASAIVHPNLLGTAYPFKGLCGAGVAFKVAWALCQLHSSASKVTPELRELLLTMLGHAAIGTIADMVPLLDENRAIVKYGLQSISKRPCLGIAALLKILQIDKSRSPAAEDIAFSIAPRLNAAGRLGQAQLGVELLITQDATRAEALAAYLNKLNEDRKTLEQSVYLAAAKQVKEMPSEDYEHAIILSGTGWHAGVIGIVAGRIAERFHRPTVIISLDSQGIKPGVGSARTIPGIDLHAALVVCQGCLVSCGGHAAAAGLRVEESKLAEFRGAFKAAIADQLESECFHPEIIIDAQATLPQLDLATIYQIELMAPFGASNPRPLIAATGVSLADPPKHLGHGEKHFSAKFHQHGSVIRGIAFGQGEWVALMTTTCAESLQELDIAFRPSVNEYNGFKSVQLQIIDWKRAKVLQTLS